MLTLTGGTGATHYQTSRSYWTSQDTYQKQTHSHSLPDNDARPYAWAFLSWPMTWPKS